MRVKRHIFFIATTIALLFIFAFNKDKKNKGKYWLNINYVKCLTSSLPCECEKATKSFFYITIDTNQASKSYGASGLRYENNELEQWDIQKQNDDTYKVYEDVTDVNSLIGNIQITKAKLCFIDVSGKKSSFVNFDGFNSIDNFQYYKQNVLLLNKSFADRRHPTLEKIIGDSLNCYCNKELGGINIITSDGNYKAWIIEHNKDSIFLYRYLNNYEKSVPLKIDRELINKYKW